MAGARGRWGCGGAVRVDGRDDMGSRMDIGKYSMKSVMDLGKHSMKSVMDRW